MSDAFIVDGIRTPIGKFAGALASVRPDDMAALCLRELLKRNPSCPAEEISDVILGCANQAGEDNRNVARMAALLAGFPVTVPGQTLNRLCASGMGAVVAACRGVMCHEGDLFIAGGVESMTRAPYVLSKSDAPFSRAAELFDTSIGWRFVNPALEALYGVEGMGETAENVASEYGVTREDQDCFALYSQEKCAEALATARFDREVVAVSITQRKAPDLIFTKDEFPRTDTTLEKLQKLRPAFREGGTVTAGNASGINDGACAILVASEGALSKYSLQPLARMVSSAVVGVEPRVMGIGPVAASKRALAQAGVSIQELDVIELNEAFASQSLACLRELGIEDRDPRVNVNGGAIALGHPLGMSGARILLTAAHELVIRGGRYALCAMCVGVGQGMACIIERVRD